MGRAHSTAQPQTSGSSLGVAMGRAGGSEPIRAMGALKAKNDSSTESEAHSDS